MTKGLTQRGSSLLEALVALAFLAHLSAQAVVWVRTIVSAERAFIRAAAIDRSLWVLADSVATDVRRAGSSATTRLAARIELATPTTVQLVADVNGDGDTTDASESVTYHWDAAAAVMRRETGNGGLQVFADDLAGLTIGWGYYDERGNRLADDPGGVPASLRRSIARIHLEARDVGGRVALSTSTTLRIPP
mgnify:CR=1 FL=1